ADHGRRTRPASKREDRERGVTLLREDVVVAGGGVVLGDHREEVGKDSQVVDAAADTQAVAAAIVPLAAVGVVLGDRTARDTEACAGRDVGPASEAVAAVATRAALATQSQIMADRRGTDRGGSCQDGKPAAPAVAAA